ncbi:hypothetical protein [Methyloceanibacter sp. wino2]|uniref:hypothetical protein n=1 Tax=Methyloceanibacter sp. wino2 TaxID=2170729 RepID=UPI000D3E99EE|nr:hypothetical protein [Methyloceanibacter sp. wino2]
MARLALNNSAEIVDLAEYRRVKDTELEDYQRRYQEFLSRYFYLWAYEYLPPDLAYAQAWTEAFGFD